MIGAEICIRLQIVGMNTGAVVPILTVLDNRSMEIRVYEKNSRSPLLCQTLLFFSVSNNCMAATKVLGCQHGMNVLKKGDGSLQESAETMVVIVFFSLASPKTYLGHACRHFRQ